MAKIYLIPGLGNDHRIFSRLVPLLCEQEVHYLDHIEPLSRNESIASYAQRLVDSIPMQEEPPVLIGMSLGGAIATEMAKQMPYKKLVLISSFKHKTETPTLFKFARRFPLYRLVPSWYVRLVLPFLAWVLGICTRADSRLLKLMLCALPATHFSWGREAIIHWDNEVYPRNFIHINGTKDHIFKRSEKQTTHLIKGGTHNMVLDRAEEIAEIINKEVFEQSLAIQPTRS